MCSSETCLAEILYAEGEVIKEYQLAEHSG